MPKCHDRPAAREPGTRGIARSGDLASLRERARQSLAASGALDPGATDGLLAQLRYAKGSDDESDTFAALRRELGAAAHPLHYLAIPPALFGPVIDGLEQSGSADGARVILEKPFGRDLAGARTLNRAVRRVFRDEAIFRIDHFLGKECVQNLLYFRFANAFLEPTGRPTEPRGSGWPLSGVASRMARSTSPTFSSPGLAATVHRDSSSVRGWHT